MIEGSTKRDVQKFTNQKQIFTKNEPIFLFKKKDILTNQNNILKNFYPNTLSIYFQQSSMPCKTFNKTIRFFTAGI